MRFSLSLPFCLFWFERRTEVVLVLFRFALYLRLAIQCLETCNYITRRNGRKKQKKRTNLVLSLLLMYLSLVSDDSCRNAECRRTGVGRQQKVRDDRIRSLSTVFRTPNISDIACGKRSFRSRAPLVRRRSNHRRSDMAHESKTRKHQLDFSFLLFRWDNVTRKERR